MRRLIAAGLIGALTACGGGGGDDDQPPTTSTNAGAAWSKLLTTGGTWSTSGTGSDGARYEISYSVTPGGMQALSGVQRATATSSSVTRRGGATVSTGTEVLYLGDNKEVLAVRAPNGDCISPSATTVPPTSAAVGASGPIYSGDLILGCAVPAFILKRVTVGWSVERDGGATYFCVDRAETGSAPGRTSSCVEVTEAGEILGRAKISASAGGLTLVTRN